MTGSVAYKGEASHEVFASPYLQHRSTHPSGSVVGCAKEHHSVLHVFADGICLPASSWLPREKMLYRPVQTLLDVLALVRTDLQASRAVLPPSSSTRILHPSLFQGEPSLTWFALS